MTQFDIGGGFPSGREPKGGVVARPSQGVSESLQTPGLAVQPAVSHEARLVGELLNALGQAGATANDYSSYKNRQRHLAKEEDALNRGLAAQNGSADMPVIDNDIETGKLKIPEGLRGEEVTAWTREYLNSRVHRDMPDAYREHYVATLTPQVERSLFSKQRDDANLAAANNLSLMASENQLLRDPEKIAANVALAKNIAPNATDDAIYTAVVLGPAKIAAANGDDEHVEAYRKVLGQRLGKQQVEIEDTLNHFHAQEFAALNKAVVDTAKMKMRQDINSAIDYGGAGKVADVVIKKPDGTLEKIDSDLERMFAFQERFRDIAKLDLPGGVLGHYSMQAKLAADNGYTPPEWTQLLKSAAVSVSTQSLSEGDATPLTDQNIRAFDLYKVLATQQPALLETVVPDAKNVEVFALGKTLQELSMVGPDNANALLNARRALSTPSALTPLNPNTLSDQIDSTFGDVKNKPEVAGIISQRVHPLVKGGIPAGIAIKKVAEDWKSQTVKINGFLVSTAGLPSSLASGLPDIAKGISETYLSKHTDATVNAKHITLRRGATDGYWTLCSNATGLVLPGQPGETMFSVRDLIAFGTKYQADKIAKKDAEIIFDQTHTDEAQPNSAAARRPSTRPKGPLLGTE